MLCRDSLASYDPLGVQAEFEVDLMRNSEQEENLTQSQQNKEEIQKKFHDASLL